LVPIVGETSKYFFAKISASKSRAEFFDGLDVGFCAMLKNIWL